jgi:hypothetical protein
MLKGAPAQSSATANITGGTISGATINSSSIGVTTPAAGQFNSLTTTFGNSSGTPGNQTSNTPSGICSIAGAGTTVTVTNSLVTATSRIFATIATNDTTATLKSVVPGSGSFVINIVAATGTTNISWFVLN